MRELSIFKEHIDPVTSSVISTYYSVTSNGNNLCFSKEQTFSNGSYPNFPMNIRLDIDKNKTWLIHMLLIKHAFLNLKINLKIFFFYYIFFVKQYIEKVSRLIK